MESDLGLDADFSARRNAGFRLRLALAIPPGRTVALLGPNAAGKTTAVAALAGLIDIDSGHIRLGGRTLDEPSSGIFVPADQRHIGVVFQDYLLFPHLGVADNIAFGLRNRGVGREAARARARVWMERLGLAGLERRKPGELSGGQAQRAALARALIIEPDLLLLDEPLAALDVTTRAKLRRELAEHLASFPGPRLVITHDPHEAFLLADEIHIIEGGVVTQTGTPDEIRLRPRTAYAADLAGSNLWRGVARERQVDVAGHVLRLGSPAEGEVLITVRPTAVSVHVRRPEGSARNVWPTRIELMERFDERIRLRTGPPLPLTAEITAEAASTLGLAPGVEIWVAIKATEIGVEGEESDDG